MGHYLLKNTNMKNHFLFFFFTFALSFFCNNPLEAQCNPDETPPSLFCINGLAAELDEFGAITLFANDFIAEVSDACDTQVDLRIALDNGAPPQDPPQGNTIILTAVGTYNVYIWAGDSSGNWTFCETFVIIGEGFGDFKVIEGKVFLDDNEDCSLTPGESGLESWFVQLALEGPSPGVELPFDAYEFYTFPDGSYSFTVYETVLNSVNSMTLQLVTSASTSGGCPNTITIDASSFSSSDTINYDLPVSLAPDCYAMQVDISTPFLRRCFDNTYNVQYCNYGGEVAENASIEITFDDFITVNFSTLPWASVDGNTYTFNLGDVSPAECGNFKIDINLSCDALLGQTHCVSAHIFPDKPCPGNYTGASLSVEGKCLGDEVEFKIKNVGEENMTAPAQYIVIEDVLMFDGGPASLNSGEEMTVNIPASGATYRMEVQQVAGHPGTSMPSAWVEGCTTGNPEEVSLGFVNQYPKNDADLFISIDCQENRGAFDPNDKQAFPKGVGAEHGVLQNVNIEYMIRFQNTGTDTAFNVVVLDTLSEWLDISTVRPGASSHDYNFNILEGHILKFSFDDIMLPDSNVNEPASNGYFKFSVAQLTNNPIGTKFSNAAAIYFDFNEPIITNTVDHTVVDHVIVVDTDDELSWKGVPVNIFPNPVSLALTVKFNDDTMREGQWQLFDYAGSVLQDQPFQSDSFEVNLRNITPGFYSYRLIDKNGNLLSTGKVVKK